MAKLAYFIMVHQLPEQFQRLLQAVWHPDNIYLVHVDKKSPAAVHQAVAETIASYDHVHLLPSRNVVWRGWSMVEVQLQGIARLLQLDEDWQHFINLSGMDFPLQPQSRVMETLSGREGNNFLELEPLHTLPEFKHTWIENVYAEWGNQVRKLPFKRRPPRGITPYSGSMWMILNRDFCRYVTGPSAIAPLKRYFRWTNVSDEIFFQTVIMNHPIFSQTVMPDNMRFIQWRSGQKHPETLTMEYLAALKDSPALFARKFDMTADQTILTQLEIHLTQPSLVREQGV